MHLSVLRILDIAGGLELALWCDFRIAAENAQFGILNVRWGVSLADGGTQRLPRVVGQGNALWMVETGMQIDAQRALPMGLVQEVVPEGRALERSLELAEHIASCPQGGIRADREAVLGTWGLDLREGLLMEERVAWPAVSSPRRPSPGWHRSPRGAGRNHLDRPDAGATEIWKPAASEWNYRCRVSDPEHREWTFGTHRPGKSANSGNWSDD